MMSVNMAAGLLGPSVYLMTVDDLLPDNVRLMVDAFGLGGLRIQTVVATPFYAILMYMILEDLYKGCSAAPPHANKQLLGCVFHILVQYFFYGSGLMRMYPCMCILIIIANSSIVALRMNISAACRIPLSAIQWPAIPFYVVGVALYITGSFKSQLPPFLSGQGSQIPYMEALIEGVRASVLETCDQRVVEAVLFVMLLWPTIYLFDFLYTSVNDICEFLGIYCFSLERRTRVCENDSDSTLSSEESDEGDEGDPVKEPGGVALSSNVSDDGGREGGTCGVRKERRHHHMTMKRWTSHGESVEGTTEEVLEGELLEEDVTARSHGEHRRHRRDDNVSEIH
eukprot:GHVQ01004718.1.p1 GENE.GHVQ01004718.1~~GHVQ01004718.1.p1  ORF type:complete len:340 (+),score=48.56 GHVQ01004718.1:265-1284(+)